MIAKVDLDPQEFNLNPQVTLHLNGVPIAQGYIESIQTPLPDAYVYEAIPYSEFQISNSFEWRRNFGLGPNPSPEDLEDPFFEAIWETIRSWDINKSPFGQSEATGNDVMLILEAIRPIIKQIMIEDPALLVTSPHPFYRECATILMEKYETISRSTTARSPNGNSET
jgi:hypothetical protein